MKQLLRLCLALFLLLTLPRFAFAQYNPNLQFNAGNPRGLNTTIDTATVGWLAITAGGEATNNWSAVQSLPFNFAFYGNPVTAFKVSRNGLITFNTATGTLPNANLDLPTNVLPDRTIACFWDQFSAAPPLPANARIYTRLFGSAGSRQLWIKWVNYEIGNPVCAFANFACVLEEGTNKVFMVDMNYSSPANVTATIGLQNTSAQAIQFGSSTFPFFSTNSGPTFADNDYYEFTPQQTSDAGVLSIDAPTVPFASGTSNVVVTLKNYSQSTLSNVTVNWRVNNVAQPDFVFSGTIAPNATLANVVIGSFNFVDGNSYAIEAETSNPNSSADINPANDKATRSACPMLLGTYTIGGTSGRFNTISEAVTMLQCAGVETAVKFVLAPGAGPFNESISLDPVYGASGSRTITFDGGSTKEKVSGSGLYTFRLNGADHIILQNMIIENTNASSGSNVLFINRADSNIVRNNYFPVKPSIILSNPFVAIVFGTVTNFTGVPNNGSYNQILNNEIDGGYGGIIMKAAAGGLDQYNRIIGNTITNVTSQGIYSVYQKMPYIQNNLIVSSGSSTSFTGIQSDNNDNFDISGNTIRNYTSYGIYISAGNTISGGVTSRAKVTNNMINNFPGGFGSYGFLLINSNFVDIYHNSISINNSGGYAMYISAGNSLNIKNNSLAIYNPTSTFTRAFSGGTNVTYTSFDYNNFFSPSANNPIRLGSTDLSPTNFQGFGGFNTNSYFGDPGYLDPLSDLHAITTQLNNKGDNFVGVTTDIDGQARPAVAGGQVDIGADEFTILPSDVAVTTLISPQVNGRVLTSKSLSATQDITIKVVNTGGAIQSNIPVYYRINGVTSAQELVPGPINPGASTNFTFSAKANLAAVGTYKIDAFAAVAADNDRSNDTIAAMQIRQLPNNPVTFPVAEGFENTPALELLSSYVGLPGAEKFDYETSTPPGRLRTFVGTGFAKTGAQSITFDRSGVGIGKPVNYLLMTMNLSGLTTSSVLMLDFSYAFFSSFGIDDPNNRVWVRGNDTAPWVEVYNLFINKLGAGIYKPVTNVNLSAALLAAGQTYSSSTQIRFGQSGTGRISNITCCDGYSFDDIAVRKLLQTDLGVTALVQPTANACGDSSQAVSVTVKNYGVASQSNIPVVVKVSGPVNTTLTGTVPGPLATDQTITFNLGTINTYTGGTFTFKAYTNMPVEEDYKNDTLKASVFLNSIPARPVAQTAVTCEGETALLHVTGTAGSYNFYAGKSGGTVLGNSVAGTFTTPPLTTTTTFYASSINSTPAEVGPKDMNIGIGGSINYYDPGLEFNVYRDLILDSVFVYPGSAGNVKVNLMNASGVVIATKTVAVTTANVKTAIPLNFRIPAGLSYKLDAQGSTVTSLFRNSNGAVFPYQIPQTLSITRGTFGTGPFYYFFYDWQVTVLECESRRVPVTATVNPAPVVNLGADIRNCNGTSVLLDAGNAGMNYAYQWSQGAFAQTISATTSGKYWVKVTNPITGCFKTDTINVFIGSSPVVNLGNDIIQCGGVVTLNAGNAGNGFDYSWSNGSATQTIGVTTSGTFSVTVTNPATGCSSTDQIQVTINPKPNVNLGADRTQCEGTVTLDAGNSGSGFTYLWSNGATTQTATISATGKYNVKVTNPATGCFNTDTINVTINTKPVVNLGPAISQCGGTTTLDAGNVGLGYTYVWSNGATTRTITASTSGTYSVTVTNPTTNCSNTSQVQVSINAIPTVNLGADQVQCGGSVTLDAGNTGLGYTYLWNNGATTKTISATATGKYWARVTNPAGNCAASDTINITIKSLPVATISANKGTAICQGDSIILSASAGSSWLWSNGATTQSIKVKTSGNYAVTLTNANNCSATSAPTTVTVTPLPVISLANQSICIGQSATLSVAPQTGVTYAWSGGQTGNSITVSPTATTTYTVTATSAGGCINSQPVTVSVNSLPTVNAGIDTATCANTPITLTATGTGTSYAWSNGQTGSSITVSPSVTTTYSVTTNNANNCTATDQVIVTVRTSPAIPTISAAGGILTSSAASGNQWFLNGTLIPGATGQNYTPTANGNYTVTTTNGQCTATSTSFAYSINGVADDEALNAQLQVYPNPTSGLFEMKLTNQTKPVMLTLYNLTGQLLAKVEVKPTASKTLTNTFDLNNFAQGIYILKLETEGKTAFRKVVRE